MFVCEVRDKKIHFKVSQFKIFVRLPHNKNNFNENNYGKHVKSALDILHVSFFFNLKMKFNIRFVLANTLVQ